MVLLTLLTSSLLEAVRLTWASCSCRSEILIDFRHQRGVRLQQRLRLLGDGLVDVAHFLFARGGALDLGELLLQVGDLDRLSPPAWRSTSAASASARRWSC